MKKILIDAVNISGGGAVQVALSVIENASRDKRYEWLLAVNLEINKQIDNKCRNGFAKTMVFKNGGFFQKILNSVKLKAKLQNLNPDLIYTVFGPTYWKTEKPQLLGFAHPLLIYPKSDWYNPNNRLEAFKHILINPLKRLNFPKKCNYVVETQEVKERLTKEFSVSDENVFVIHNSVSPFFLKENSRFRLKKINKRTKFSVFVPSAYYSHKNLEITPWVASEMLKMGFSNFEFTFIISPKSRGWKNISRIASKLGVKDKLVTLGVLPHAQMATQYKKSDIVFLPTFVEASTAVYPESFMARKPLITSGRPFARELCGEGAIYFNPRNPKEIASKIVNLKSNTKLQNCLIENGIESLNKNYPSPVEKWKALLNVIETLLEKED